MIVECAEMDLFSSQYEFFDEIGLNLANPGFFVNGPWKGYSEEITSHSSVNNDVKFLFH